MPEKASFSENSITRHGIFLVTIPLLDFVTLHLIQRKSSWKSSIDLSVTRIMYFALPLNILGVVFFFKVTAWGSLPVKCRLTAKLFGKKTGVGPHIFYLSSGGGRGQDLHREDGFMSSDVLIRIFN